MNQLDFLAIGDVVTDAFIRLKDAEVNCDVDQENCKLCVRFGDKIPYESMEEVRAVGNSANAAVAAARLGVASSLLAHVGKDYQGEACLAELRKNGVDTALMGVHEGMPTNYHYVLWYDVERTILVKHTPFPVALPKDLPPPKMLYLSSLGEGTESYHQEIATFAEAHPEIILVFQPGTFQMKMGTGALGAIYRRTNIFFANLEEARRILKTDEKNPKVLLAGIHALGPKLVFLTDGIKGAYGSNGLEAWFIPVYPHKPYERTGAGDAFAATVATAILLGKSPAEALSWGPVNSMSVVQYVGAQAGLLSREKIESHLASAPSDYQPVPFL